MPLNIHITHTPFMLVCIWPQRVETEARIHSDAKDRSNIKNKLEESIHPLDTATHPSGLVQVVTGKIVNDDVDVDNSVAIGEQMMADFVNAWPDSFTKQLPKCVKTMHGSKASTGLNLPKAYNSNAIYTQVIGLQASGRDLDLEDVLSYELAAVPISLFTETGDLQIPTSKATLKNKLKVEVSPECIPKPTDIVIDGGAMLWVVHWPSNGTVKDNINNVLEYIERRLRQANVYLVFDRYIDYSIKSATRCGRTAEASRRHQLSCNMQLPPRKVVLSSSHNKIQLIQLIVGEIVVRKQDLQTGQQKLFVTGQDGDPLEFTNGLCIQRADMRTTHEEADVIIIQQLLSITNEEETCTIKVIADDTDVFVLLLYYYNKYNLDCCIVMEEASKERKCVDIKATVQKHKQIIPSLPSAHSLSGCDTVAQCWGIGKAKVVKVLQTGVQMFSLGNIAANLPDVLHEATVFTAACYGHPETDNLGTLHFKVWKGKTGRASLVSSPKLMSLPPTFEAFKLNVERAHFQACIWLNCDNLDPPKMDPEEYGWVKDRLNKTLMPVMTPKNTLPAPEYILKLIKCTCEHCSTAKCSCATARLQCSVFCKCDGGSQCRNPEKLINEESSDEETN